MEFVNGSCRPCTYCPRFVALSLSPINRKQHARDRSEPSQQNIIACGQLAVVHQLSDKLIRKLPLDKSFYSEQAIQIEAQIYMDLGRQKRIARCPSYTLPTDLRCPAGFAYTS